MTHCFVSIIPTCCKKGPNGIRGFQIASLDVETPEPLLSLQQIFHWLTQIMKLLNELVAVEKSELQTLCLLQEV